MALALAVALLASEPTADGARYAITALLAGAMGIQNAAAGRLNVPELTTTVLTKTITALASDAASAGHGAKPLHTRRLVAVGAMLLGALTGGLLVLHVSIGAALGVACGLSAGVALIAHVVSRGRPEWART